MKISAPAASARRARTGEGESREEILTAFDSDFSPTI